ncbi:MAG: hypothetical protein LBP87_14420, partial [Planctomycetaceae bacterium]|nr:hypothetical protein [Planctomycetaceae bacterium]
EHKRQKGDRVGHHWRIPGATGTRSVRHVMIDTNYWKTFVQKKSDNKQLPTLNNHESVRTEKGIGTHRKAVIVLKWSIIGRFFLLVFCHSWEIFNL